MFPPSRIVYLTEETVETLYLLGEQDRIVGISAMSCARLKHSLTAPAYSEQRSTLAKELGLGRKSTPAVASAPATGAPAAKEQVETSPQIEAGPSFQPAVRTSLPAPIAVTTAGSTLTWSGPSCARLSKAHALRRRPSGLVEPRLRPSTRSHFKLSRAPATSRAMEHTVCRRAPGSVQRGDGAARRCRHGSADRWGTPGKAPVGSYR